MTSFLGWRRAFKSAVMTDDQGTLGTGNFRRMTRNRRPLELAVGGGCARRARAWQARASRRHAAQGAPSSAGVRLERLLHRRPYRLRPRHFKRGALRSAAGLDQQCRQRRDRRRAGRLQCAPAVRTAARRRSRSDVSELLHLELDRLHSRRRALRSRREAGLCRNRARPPRLCQRALAFLRHRRLRLCRRALHQHARRRRR